MSENFFFLALTTLTNQGILFIKLPEFSCFDAPGNREIQWLLGLPIETPLIRLILHLLCLFSAPQALCVLFAKVEARFFFFFPAAQNANNFCSPIDVILTPWCPIFFSFSFFFWHLNNTVYDKSTAGFKCLIQQYGSFFLTVVSH